MYLDTYKFKYCNCLTPFSGIYALIYDGEVIYIGQSVNVRSRLMEHRRVDYQIKRAENEYQKYGRESFLNTKQRYEFIKEHFDNIEFLVLPTEKAKLDEVEEEYINKYKPRFNWHGVRVEYPHHKAS